MPVGTQGAVKGVTHRELDALGAEILLSNTYHLYLRPGDDLIARRGGLHRFIGWSKPILTDSGGYQVFSLSNAPHHRRAAARTSARTSTARRISLTPEKAADIQAQLGSDIAMVLDECLAHPGERRRGARVDGAHAALGAAAARDRFLALRDGLVPGVDGQQPGPGAVRHRAGRRLSGAARRERAADRRDRLRGLRDRRPERRRAARRHVRHGVADDARACRRTGRAI